MITGCVLYHLQWHWLYIQLKSYSYSHHSLIYLWYINLQAQDSSTKSNKNVQKTKSGYAENDKISTGHKYHKRNSVKKGGGGGIKENKKDQLIKILCC